MKYALALAATLLLAACAPAPVRPPPAVLPQADAQALAAVKQREALREAELERERAELRRREAEARQPRTGAVRLAPSIAAQPLEPVAAPVVEPAAAPVVEPAAAPAVEPAGAPAVEPPQEPLEPGKPEVAKVQPAKTDPLKSEPARLEPARIDPWQLSNDLRRLHTRVEVQTFYNERGWVVSLAAESLFEPGEANIREGGQDTLDRLARVLRHYAARGIVMDGPELERAQAIRRALSERGIPEQAITANGVGERVEFLVPHAGLNAGAGS
jgi:outer membrane protein OmpA-like peptidoglycan-associated protein